MQMPSRTLNLIRGTSRALAIVAAAILLSFFSFGYKDQSAAQAARNQNQRRPVLVELFTSEGCSDCPPADALLAMLDKTQYIPGAEAIVLSEHVTYFNEGGWRDPFSSEAMTQRQQAYEQQFQLSDLYTPQMVVDGTEQFVGNDAGKLDRAVATAAMTPKLDVEIANLQREADGAIDFSVHAPGGAKASVIAAVALNAATSQVRRGENAGHTLHHVAVARFIKNFGSSAVDGRALRLAGGDLADAKKSGASLRLVVFLVNANGRVMGATEQMLPGESLMPGGTERAALR